MSARELFLGVVLGPPWRREPTTEAGRWGRTALAVGAALAAALVALVVLTLFD